MKPTVVAGPITVVGRSGGKTETAASSGTRERPARLRDSGIRAALRVEVDLLCVELRVNQLEADAASMRERLADHRRRTGTPSRRLERAVAELDAELADIQDWLGEVHGQVTS